MKKYLPITVIVLVAIGAFLWYRSRPTNSPQTVGEQINEMSEWASAVASGKPVTCTISREGEEMEYLVMDTKMKGRVSVSREGVSMVSYMVNDSAYLYYWQDGAKQGTKLAIPKPGEASPTPTDSTVPETPKFDESGLTSLENSGYTINCKESTAVESDFVPPAGITFTDPTEMMKKLPSAGAMDLEKAQEMAKQYGITIPESN